MTVAPPQRYRSLDAWRGVACLAVIVFHSTYYVATDALESRIAAGHAVSAEEWLIWLTSKLWVGVPLFFVISGYCIAASAETDRRQGRPTARFFVRRFRRIYPPLWAFLAVFVSFVDVTEWARPGLLADQVHPIGRYNAFSIWNWIGSLTLTEGWRSHLVGGRPQTVFVHLWTLCYEEQFYVIVGLLLLLSRRRIVLGLAIVSVFVLAIRAVVPQPMLQGYFFDGLWLEFAAGTAVFYAVTATSAHSRWMTGVLLCVALATQVRHFTSWSAALEDANAQTYAAAFAFALLLLVLHPYDQQIDQSAWTQPLRFCGQICYSLYLVQWPIAKLVSHALFLTGATGMGATLFITIPTSVAASVVVAWAFHRLVERHFLPGRQTEDGAIRRARRAPVGPAPIVRAGA